MNKTLSIISVIITFLVVIAGRITESYSLTLITTSKTLTFDPGSCWPMLATSVTFPVKLFSGKASIPISTLCPSLTLLMSISLT